MIDAEDRALLEKSVQSALADVAPGADVDALLAEIDWRDLLEAEPADAIDLVFRALGSVDVRSSALDDVLLHALGIEPRDDLAVVLPLFGSWQPPGQSEGAEEDVITVRGLVTARAARAKKLICVSGPAESPRITTFDAPRATCTAITGIDPASAYQSVHFEGRVDEAAPLDPSHLREAVALARRAVATQIAGANRTMLDMARTHALEREQFGKPIAQFQAVRHRLSEALVAVESTEACLVAARDEPNDQTAALAKALASRNARVVARHCQQVLAGVGFTTEHAFHLFLKRVMALEGLFGTADEILLEVGRGLLATREAPPLIEL